MQCTKILTDKNNEELAVHGNYEFPCAIYFSYVSKYTAGEIAWHWHKEIEIITIYQGVLYVEIEDKKFILSKGESLFINSEEMHFMRMDTKEECIIISFVFDKIFVCGEKGSNIDQKYMVPLINCKELSALELAKDDSRKLIEAYSSYSDNSLGYEITVRNILSEILLNIIKENQELLEKSSSSNNVDRERMKYMLTFIHNNYSEDINLSQIAKEAFIGEREALRCFGRTVGTSPIEYLLKYRIYTAAEMLRNGGQLITEICLQTGFNSPSYFSKVFCRMLGVTPKEYRKNKLKLDVKNKFFLLDNK
ncbi:AraC family transcriptional regulator [Fusobacterium sp.]|uniref:helix-turn-helix domain-containing protein n=1 Tax=Fusobacterium sp. TaxID=68766 RepID=UPI002904D0A9|nr:AraC family transcriptional regulator [Fusobacterium sp.]MDU1909644.1 AraC family transcriptional regulator [Fusobacterium sp.]